MRSSLRIQDILKGDGVAGPNIEVKVYGSKFHLDRRRDTPALRVGHDLKGRGLIFSFLSRSTQRPFPDGKYSHFAKCLDKMGAVGAEKRKWEETFLEKQFKLKHPRGDLIKKFGNFSSESNFPGVYTSEFSSDRSDHMSRIKRCRNVIGII